MRIKGFGPKQVSHKIGMSLRSQLSGADILAASAISNEFNYLSTKSRAGWLDDSEASAEA